MKRFVIGNECALIQKSLGHVPEAWNSVWWKRWKIGFGWTCFKCIRKDWRLKSVLWSPETTRRLAIYRQRGKNRGVIISTHRIDCRPQHRRWKQINTQSEKKNSWHVQRREIVEVELYGIRDKENDRWIRWILFILRETERNCTHPTRDPRNMAAVLVQRFLLSQGVWNEKWNAGRTCCHSHSFQKLCQHSHSRSLQSVC